MGGGEIDTLDRTKPEACFVVGRDHGSRRLGRRWKPLRLMVRMIEREGSQEDWFKAYCEVGRTAAERCS